MEWSDRPDEMLFEIINRTYCRLMASFFCRLLPNELMYGTCCGVIYLACTCDIVINWSPWSVDWTARRGGTKPSKCWRAAPTWASLFNCSLTSNALRNFSQGIFLRRLHASADAVIQSGSRELPATRPVFLSDLLCFWWDQEKQIQICSSKAIVSLWSFA